MRAISITQFIFLGTCIRYLQDVQPGWRIKGDGLVLNNIEAFQDHLEQLDCKVTIRLTKKLGKIIKKLSKAKKNSTLTQEDASELRNTFLQIRDTLMAEAGLKTTFTVSEKRLDVTKLLNDVSGLMSPGVFEKLPYITQQDFIEAGKCIAFERPTAGAFHLLRGTEGGLRFLYRRVVKQRRLAPKNQTWGNILKELSKRKKNKPPSELVGNLDDIRNHFRNPTQHPEKNYDIEEVQDLFGRCVDAVNRIVKFLKEKSLL